MALAYASQPNRSRTVFYGKFNYAEMVALLAPRLFLVECGHWDGVAPDEWAVYEYAKVRRLYDTLEIDDRTDIIPRVALSLRPTSWLSIYGLWTKHADPGSHARALAHRPRRRRGEQANA